MGNTLTDSERIAALEAAVAKLQAATDPQAVRNALETTSNPRGLADELLVQDAAGNPVQRRNTVQFLSTVEDDPAAKRTVVHVGSGIGGAARVLSAAQDITGTTAAGLAGLDCAVTVNDSGDGTGLVLFAYAAYFNMLATTTHTWDFAVDGAVSLPPNTAASAGPSSSYAASSAHFMLHTADASGNTALVPGSPPSVTGGLTVTGSLALSYTAGWGPMPTNPILWRVSAGNHTLSVLWHGSAAGAHTRVHAAVAMAIPL